MALSFFPTGRLVRALSSLAVCMALAGGAQAQQAVTSAAGVQDLQALTQRWVDDALARTDGAQLPLRMQVSVGALDPRLRLAPCDQVEPYLPAGAQLWGRTRLGLRCVQGSVRWNVFVPLTVSATGPAWVLTGPVAAGQVLTEADAVEAEVDWAEESAPILANSQTWVGQVAARSLSAGQALRQNMVRAPNLFKPGAPVRIIVQGPGYEVTSSGQAMTAGAAGQNVRIRMSNGRIIQGVVAEDGTVQAGV